MKKALRRIMAVALSLSILACALAAPALAAAPGTDKLTTLIEGAVAYKTGAAAGLVNEDSLKDLAALDWWVFGAARAGLTEDYDAYLTATSNFLRTTDGQSVTDLERIMLSVKATGGNPEKIGGRNLVRELEMANMSTISAAIYGLFCLSGVNYTPSVDAVNTPDSLIDTIDSLKLANGSFAFDTQWAPDGETDMTALAVQALAPYYNTSNKAKTIIDAALGYLSSEQEENGHYMAWGANSSGNLVQVIMALCALGKDPATEADFQKVNGDLMSALASFENADGSFGSGAYDVTYATKDGLLCFTALKRFYETKNSIYDLRDAAPFVPPMTVAEITAAAGTYQKDTVLLKDKDSVGKLLVYSEILSAGNPSLDTVIVGLEEAFDTIKLTEETVKTLGDDIFRLINPADITLADKDVVDALKARYDALHEEDRVFVENAQDLLYAVGVIESLSRTSSEELPPQTGTPSMLGGFAVLSVLSLAGATLLYKKIR